MNYTSGSESATLVFNYTVQNGDVASDLDYTGTTALALNGGTIKDIAGNAATLTLKAVGASGSLGDAKALVVDGALPTISTVAANAGTKTITLTMSENVSGSPANGDFSVLVGSASNAVTNVAISSKSVVLTVTNFIANDATVTVGYTQSSSDSAKMKDAAGNAVATLSSAK